MSRSRRPSCSVGRGCGCCGDAGANRRKRERAWSKADGRHVATSDDAKSTGHPRHWDAYYCRTQWHYSVWQRSR